MAEEFGAEPDVASLPPAGTGKPRMQRELRLARAARDSMGRDPQGFPVAMATDAGAPRSILGVPFPWQRHCLPGGPR